MKGNFWKKLLTFMSCIVATLGLMCFVSCAADAGGDSDDNNTDKLVLDFNGGTMHGHKTVEFSMDDITPHVGKAIDEAFKCLGLDTAFIKKEGFYLHGWTLKKNGETCVTNLPTFGTLYAKWGTDPITKDEDVPLTLTLNFNGGKLDGASFKYFDNSKVEKYAGKTIDEALEGLGVSTITKENYELVGWTDNLTTANEVTTLPTKGNVTLYAMWKFNGAANPLTLTLDFNGGMSGEESYFVLTDDLIADYKGMPIAQYFKEKNKPLPTKEGYTLIGWSTTRNGEATIVDIPLEGTVKYYAVWEEVGPEKLTFTLDAGKGWFVLATNDQKVKTLTTEFEAGAKLEEVFDSLPECKTPVPFAGNLEKGGDYYSYEENGTYYYCYAYSDRKGIEVDVRSIILNVLDGIPMTNITLTENTTFYVEYRECVDVLFDLNGGYIESFSEGDGIVTSTELSIGINACGGWTEIRSSMDAKKDGYVLEGFTYTKDGSDFVTEVPLEDCTIYAKWALPKECTLTLKSAPYSTFIDDNGKSLGSELKITYTTGSTLGEILEQKNMSDYFVDESELKYKSYVEFAGFVAEDVLYYESSVLTKDLTLSVKTQPIQLRVRFDYNEGTDNNGETYFRKVILGKDIQTKISTQSIASIIEEYNVPTPTKEGYKLVGWGYDSETPIEIIDKTVEELLSGKAYLDLYAVWQEKDEPTDPEPEKLTFTWDAGKGRIHDFEKDELLKTISVEFDPGATYEEISNIIMEKYDHINIMYLFEEDDIKYSYKENGTYYILEEIKDNKDNVIMNVWTNTGTGMSSNQKVYEDITYYFEYVKLVKITYNSNGGYFNEEGNVTTDSEYIPSGYGELSYHCERDGYVFMGWTLTKDGNDFVTVVPSEETELYAKWELPKECTLTINAGEYSQLFDRDGNSLGKEVNLTFTSGKTIEEVLEENNINGYSIVNRFEIEDAYYRYTFVDLKDYEYSNDEILKDSITLYPQPTNLDEYRGILKYYDYVNDYGNYDEKAEPEYEVTYDEYIFEKCLNTPYADGYTFLGWTYTPNGNDYVNLNDYIPAGVTTTVYAKWIPESEVKPLYEYSSDNSQITFTFVPSYFGYDWDSDEFHEVQLLSDATTWAPDERYFMTKDEDGIYTITFDYVNSVYLGFKNWPGFKFLVIEEDIMLGPNEYKISLSNDKIIGPEDSPHFKMEFISSLLTLDLNGGSVNGKTDDILLDSDDIYNRLLVDCFENPIKDGYIFAGWTSTRDEEDYVTYVPAGIDVLYAKWVEPTSGVVTLIARENEVFYDYKGQPLENELSFDFEAGITLGDLLNQYNIDYSNMVYPYENNNEAFVFAEFVDGNGNQYDSTKILTASVTLYPTYHSRAIVNFDLNGGYIDNSQGVRVEGTWTNYVPYGIWFDQWVDGIPQKEGYNFVGWSTSGYADELVTQVTSSCSVCAIWQDPLELFINGDIVGTLTIDETGNFEDGHSLKYEGEGVYTYAFTFDSKNMVGWDAPSNGIAFKLRPVKESWAISYGIIYQGEHPVIGGGEVVTTAVGGAPNIIVGGLKDGNSYIITVRCTEDGDVFVKIDEA